MRVLVKEPAAMTIPFENQEAEGKCGAAALCMLYRSFGADCSQAEVWDKVSRPSAGRGRRGRTYLLAADAIERGYAALVIKADDPWKLLQRCHTHTVGVILNHRLRANQTSGHYSVVVDVGDDHIVLHDPREGPDQRLTRDELLQLWKSEPMRSEITGYVMVAISRTDVPAAPCSQGHDPVPETLACRRCQKQVKLQPAAILGCMAENCPDCTWNRVYCPFCDNHLAFKSGSPFAPFDFLSG